MSFQSKPTTDGLYRIKLYSSDLYMEFAPDGNTWIKLVSRDASSSKQKWKITSQSGDDYFIASNYDNRFLTSSDASQVIHHRRYPVGRNVSTKWSVKEDSSRNFSKITLSGASDPLDSQSNAGGVVHFNKAQNDANNQKWVFEPLEQGGQPSSSQPTGKQNASQQSARKRTGKAFEDIFFPFTVEDAVKYTYDIIIVGTGIGGGVIAGDLFDTNSMLGKNARHILVIEKGGLVFHTHCLNAARPSGLGEDRGQQNDTFFEKFKDDYDLSSATNASDLKAGPMFCLGGRSAAWGLFVPRIHDDTFETYFDRAVHDDLIAQYYRMAEELMTLSLPTTKIIHQDLMERLNMTIEDKVEAIKTVQWQWGRIASEFREDRNYDFARGAYSTIDKLLEIAMSKPKGENGKEREHDNFKQLLGVEVRRLEWDSERRVTGVCVRDRDGKENVLKVNVGGKVALCAGSVASAAILLRSGVPLQDANYGGLHITDHDIFFKARSFRYKNPLDRDAFGPMKLQTFVKISKGEVVLANMSIDASSFLPRGIAQLDDFPKFIIACIRKARLNPANTIKMVDDEPVVTLNRDPASNLTDSDSVMKALKEMTEVSVKTMKEVLNIEFLPDPTTSGPSSQYFKALEIGGVAHELGTIPMKGPRNGNAYSLDTDLKLRGYEGVYVCDLSVFPMSPEVNPTLTLAALALRLSRRILLPRDFILDRNLVVTLDTNNVYVVNHKGRKVKVWLSNRAGVDTTHQENDVIMGPGEYHSWRRKMGIIESLSVFELAYLSTDKFLDDPWLMTAQPGKVSPVL